MVASHAARLAELNVAPEVIAALPECAREPPVVGGVRVMSWNILAEGMSYDGFHVRDVIAPDDEGSPSADTFLQLFGELLAAKADGKPAAMEALKARLETARSRRNLDAVVDWQRRWCRIREQIAATAPDVIALQELDRAEDVQRDLAALGYTMSYTPLGDAPAAASTGAGTGTASTASLSLAAAGRTAAVPIAATPYTPYRCAPRHAKEAQGLLANADAYLEDAEASRCAFAPKSESICRKLGLQNRKAGRGGENERFVRDEAERAFKLCDVSSDGKLDLDELAKMTGFSKMAKNLLGKADVDSSGQLTMDEWATYIESKGEQAAKVLQLYENALAKQQGGEPVGAPAQRDVDDDGSAIFWRASAFEAVEIQHLVAHDTKPIESRFKGFVHVRLRRTGGPDGAEDELSVIAGHLTSGAKDSDEALRLTDLTARTLSRSGGAAFNLDGGAPSLLEVFAKAAAERPTVLCLDANSGPDRAASAPLAWRAMRGATAGSCWDEFYDANGVATGRPPPVTSNKLRGPLSGQPAKIGEHVYQLCDHVLFSSQLHLTRHALAPRVYASLDDAQADLLPTLAMPSDHHPVVTDLGYSRAHCAKLREGRLAAREAHGEEKRREAARHEEGMQQRVAQREANIKAREQRSRAVEAAMLAEE